MDRTRHDNPKALASDVVRRVDVLWSDAEERRRICAALASNGTGILWVEEQTDITAAEVARTETVPTVCVTADGPAVFELWISSTEFQGTEGHLPLGGRRDYAAIGNARLIVFLQIGTVELVPVFVPPLALFLARYPDRGRVFPTWTLAIREMHKPCSPRVFDLAFSFSLRLALSAFSSSGQGRTKACLLVCWPW